MEENRTIKSTDKIPGCERLTRPEEIKGLSKYLGAIKETQEAWIEENMPNEIDSAGIDYEEVDTLPENSVNVPNSERGNIENLPESIDKLKNATKEISELPDSVITLNTEKDKLKLDIERLHVPQDKLNPGIDKLSVEEIDGLHTGIDKLRVKEEEDLRQRSIGISVDEVESLPDGVLTIETRKEKLNTKKELLDVKDNAKLSDHIESLFVDDPKLKTHRVSLDKGATIESLPDGVLGINPKEVDRLPNRRLDISPTEPRLNQGIEELEVDDSVELPKNVEEIEDLHFIDDLPKDKLKIYPSESPIPHEKVKLDVPETTLNRKREKLQRPLRNLPLYATKDPHREKDVQAPTPTTIDRSVRPFDISGPSDWEQLDINSYGYKNEMENSKRSLKMESMEFSKNGDEGNIIHGSAPVQRNKLTGTNKETFDITKASNWTPDETYAYIMRILASQPYEGSKKLAGIVSAYLSDPNPSKERLDAAFAKINEYFTTQNELMKAARQVPTRNMKEMDDGSKFNHEKPSSWSTDDLAEYGYNRMPDRTPYKLELDPANISTYTDVDKFLRATAELSQTWWKNGKTYKKGGNFNPSGWARKLALDTILRGLQIGRSHTEKLLEINRDRLPGTTFEENGWKKAARGIANTVKTVETAANSLKSGNVQGAVGAIFDKFSGNPDNRPQDRSSNSNIVDITQDSAHSITVKVSGNGKGEEVVERYHRLPEGPKSFEEAAATDDEERGIDTGYKRKRSEYAWGDKDEYVDNDDPKNFPNEYTGNSIIDETFATGIEPGDFGIGLTIKDLCPTSEFTGQNKLKDLKAALEDSPYITTPKKLIKGLGATTNATLDTNAYWEAIVEPLCGDDEDGLKKLNGGWSYLPSIAEINAENNKEHGVNTWYSKWIPISNLELQKTKLNSKSLGLYDGEINYPVSVEYTNELRMTVVDDQFKSWRRYFQRCADVSVFNSEPHDKSFYQTSPYAIPTAIDKTRLCVAYYKNVTFRIRLYFMTPQYSTIKKFDLLCVLKDFSEEYIGDIEGGGMDLNVAFSIVGENPEENTIEYQINNDGTGGWVNSQNEVTTTVGASITDTIQKSNTKIEENRQRQVAHDNNKITLNPNKVKITLPWNETVEKTLTVTALSSSGEDISASATSGNISTLTLEKDSSQSGVYTVTVKSKPKRKNTRKKSVTDTYTLTSGIAKKTITVKQSGFNPKVEVSLVPTNGATIDIAAIREYNVNIRIDGSLERHYEKIRMGSVSNAVIPIAITPISYKGVSISLPVIKTPQGYLPGNRFTIDNYTISA